jgi:hypothetical protein
VGIVVILMFLVDRLIRDRIWGRLPLAGAVG